VSSNIGGKGACSHRKQETAVPVAWGLGASTTRRENPRVDSRQGKGRRKGNRRTPSEGKPRKGDGGAKKKSVRGGGKLFFGTRPGIAMLRKGREDCLELTLFGRGGGTKTKV